jgi:UDP-N-acetylglucosamine acyltransferase
MAIHESVIIENGAKIADDVEIGPFCKIGKDVILESGCKLESNIILRGNLHIHADVKIFSFTTIGSENSTISVGENTHIREFVQIGSQEDKKTSVNIKVGANNFLMGYVQILSGVILGDFCIITNAVKLYENVSCDEGVIVGGLSTIEANNKIGRGVMIGGASVVNTDIPPFTLVEGNRASVKGLNVIGLRRTLENVEDLEVIKAIYKQVLGDTTDKELALKISQEHENEYVKIFTSFIAQSNLS